MKTYIGNVIRIIDEFTIIINAGDHSVSKGDKIQVYEILDSIIDLDGSDLGEYIFVKDELEVLQVEDNYSICRKNKSVSKPAAVTLALSPLLERTYTEKIPLDVDSEDLNPLPLGTKTIRIGDKVRKI